MSCLQAKFMSLRSQLVERSLEKNLQLDTIVLNYPILWILFSILCLFFVFCADLMCFLFTSFHPKWPETETSKVQLVPPAGWPWDVLKWTKCRASWNSRRLRRTSTDPQNMSCYGKVSKDWITSATSEFVFQTESLIWKAKRILVMTSGCTVLYSNEKDCVF